MPFTFSHPAIILPLLKLGKNRVSATALVAGSMAPDFEYFINFQMKQVHGHTTAGILYYNLPLTLLLCFAYHFLIRDALIHYSPTIIKNRWCHFIGYDWKKRWASSWKIIIISALIGISSHLFWDSFTHPNRLMTNTFSVLSMDVSILGWEMEIHDFLQIFCSLLGLIAIGIVILNEPVKREFRSGFKTKIIYWLMILILSFIVVLLRDCQSINDLIATTIAAFCIALMISPFIMKQLNIEEEQIIF